MTRAIITAFHKYQPYGEEYYQPIFDFFVSQMSKFKDEYDKIYFIDSTWNFTDDDYEKMKTVKGKLIKVNPSLRYYDAYKEILPQVDEELILFMDNDMVIYKEGIISDTFDFVESYSKYDVASIIDEIGEYKTDKLKQGNKFCPYWLAAYKSLLMKYLDVNWAPDMPYCETLGHLTEAMLNDGVRVFELEDDKSNILFDGSSTEGWNNFGKDLGYYHIRAGSTPAVLLAYRKHDPDKYWEYLKNQPKSEYLRQFAWYWWMAHSLSRQRLGKDKFASDDYQLLQGEFDILREITDVMTKDLGLGYEEFREYFRKMQEYHGLS